MKPEAGGAPIEGRRASRVRGLLFAALKLALPAYLVFSVAFGIRIADANARRTRRPITSTPADLSPRARRLAFPARDGLALEGYLAPPLDGRPVLIMQHGIGNNRDDTLPWARSFAAVGYGVLCFDWRAHGRSAGDVIAFGGQEPRDLEGALAELERLPETRGRPVAILATSMGAACTAMAAPVLPAQVRCLVLDSPYGNLSRMADHRLRGVGPALWLARTVLDRYSEHLTGLSPAAVRPEEVLAAFAPRPILVMHGSADAVIPFSEGKSLYECYPGPKESWFTEGDAHADSRWVRRREWMTRVATFLAAHLPGAPEVAEVLAVEPAPAGD